MIAALGVAIALAGSGGAPPVVSPAGPPDSGAPSAQQVAERLPGLRAARSVWRSARLRNYTYRIQRLCFCGSPNPVKIIVRSGRPRGTPAAFRDVDTAAELFRTVDALRKSHTLEVRYSGRGVPLRIEADRIKFAIDDEVTYVVSRFRRLK